MGFLSSPLGAALVTGGASLVGGMMRNQAQEGLSREQMKFQERMSNTAYQRGMEDMRKAGLNPILAAKTGGASTPGGSMPNLTDPISSAVQTGQSVFQAGNDASLKNATTQLTQSKNKLTEALVPGAQAIQTITEEINKLAQAAQGLIGQSKAGYDEMLTELQGTVLQWLNKAKEYGGSTVQIINQLPERARKFAKDAEHYVRELVPDWEK